MPRARYPSDDRRLKSRPHVKVHLSIQGHPRFAEAFADPEIRGIIVGLWVVARRNFAGRTGDCVTLTHADLMWVTGRERLGTGLARLRQAAGTMGYSVRQEGRTVVVEVRNFSKKQGFDSADRGATPPTPPPSDSDTNTEGRGGSLRGEAEPREPEPPRDVASPDGSARASPGEDQLSPKRVQQLVEMRPKGVTYSAEQVAAWYAAKAPKMRAAGRRNLWRTAVEWWSHVTWDEVQECIQARENRALAALREQAARAPPEPASDAGDEWDQVIAETTQVIGTGGTRA